MCFRPTMPLVWQLSWVQSRI